MTMATTAGDPRADDLLAVWFADGPDAIRKLWFRKDDAFDATLRERFGDLLAPAREGALDAWAVSPRGALALALLLDQLPRNLHRGDAAAFASDPAALRLARRAVLERRLDLRLTATERVFLYLPFEHSEALADQHLCVALCEGALRDHPAHAAPGSTIEYAWRHRAVVARFGRFPHRNAVLGRDTTPEEAAFLGAHPLGF